MRRLVVALLALLAASPASLALQAGTALAAASGPALVPGALDGAAKVKAGALDASDRWIVVLRGGSSDDQESARAKSLGVHQDHQFKKSFHGYSARLTNAQLSFLRADPKVETVVPDDIVSVTGQTVPTGVSRVFGRYDPIAPIDGHDTRVDADVAIVDTGIDSHHPDLNVVGGINCSTSDSAAWYDSNGHGTHVAGIVGALDNGIGVVGVAPGVRLWAVRILDPAGNGLLSWYVCGLDWIAAQKDAADPSRPLFEAVNMSVQKPGHDDHNCGYTNSDVMHRAVCRVVDAGIPVIAAAGNNRGNVANWIPAAYSEVITVSALADTDGRPGGRGGHACFSWNSWDKDDTFADFSNYGAGVDLIAPGKCILSTLPGDRYGVLSGTSMAAPLVTGAAALWKSSRPLATPAQVKAALQAMGNLDWNIATDPDKYYHEPLLDVSWIVDLGDFFVRDLQRDALVNAAGATLKVPMNVVRAEDFSLPVDVSVSVPAPVTVALSRSHFAPADPNPLGVTITVPPHTASGTYPVVVTATDGARERTATVRVVVDSAVPVAQAATIGAVANTVFAWTSFRSVARWPAATDAFGGVTGYQARWRVDRGWGAATNLSSAARSFVHQTAVGHTYAIEIRAGDAAGNWSPWVSQPATGSRLVQDTSTSIVRRGRWSRVASSTASGGTLMYSRQAGASFTYSFGGRGIAIVAPKGPGRAPFDVWIDGVRVATVNQYAATYSPRLLLFATQGLASGAHTLRVVEDSASTNRQRTDIDALIVLQ